MSDEKVEIRPSRDPYAYSCACDECQCRKPALRAEWCDDCKVGLHWIVV